MSAEDLEKYETEMELTLYREYRDVVGIFKYVVETDRRFYLCNQVDVKARTESGDVFFEVSMTDAWVWDMYRPGPLRQERQGADVQGRQRRGAQPAGDRPAQGVSPRRYLIRRIGSPSMLALQVVVSRDAARELDQQPPPAAARLGRVAGVAARDRDR